MCRFMLKVKAEFQVESPTCSGNWVIFLKFTEWAESLQTLNFLHTGCKGGSSLLHRHNAFQLKLYSRVSTDVRLLLLFGKGSGAENMKATRFPELTLCQWRSHWTVFVAGFLVTLNHTFFPPRHQRSMRCAQHTWFSYLCWWLQSPLQGESTVCGFLYMRK